MNFIRKHWFQFGFLIAVLLGIIVFFQYKSISSFRLLLTISFITLLLHQFEEYQLPGYFPRMINTVMFKSKSPDRYPLNTNTALVINVGLGWLLYILAIVFAQQAVWLAIISITISAGNFIAHTFMFNIKGKTLYNPGMLTSVFLFLPITVYFFIFLGSHNLLHLNTLLVGLILGAIVNYFGVLRLITFLGKKNTRYIFKPFH